MDVDPPHSDYHALKILYSLPYTGNEVEHSDQDCQIMNIVQLQPFPTLLNVKS
jgi:hypothetical protein